MARYPKLAGIGSVVGHRFISQKFLSLLKEGKVSGSYDAPSDLDKQMRTWGYRKSGNNRYFIFVGFAKDEYLAGWRREVFNSCIIFGIFALVSILASRSIFLWWKRYVAADKSHRESEERFKKMFRTHGAVMLLIEPGAGMIIDANISAEKFYGYSHDDLLAMNIFGINQLAPEILSDELRKAQEGSKTALYFPTSWQAGKFELSRFIQLRSGLRQQLFFFPSFTILPSANWRKKRCEWLKRRPKRQISPKANSGEHEP